MPPDLYSGEQNRFGAIAVILSSVLVVAFLAAQPASGFSGSPFGKQRLLVIPIEYTKPYCPRPTVGFCPDSPGDWISSLAPPRDTPAELQGFLNAQLNAFYGAATFGQASFDVRVLADPKAADGWWPSSRSIQEYFLNSKYDSNTWGWLDPTPATIASAGDFPPAAMFPDNVRSVIDQAVGLGLISPADVKTYTRVTLLDNGARHLGQTWGVYNLTTKLAGSLEFTANVLSQSFNDFDSLGAETHELGHHFGISTHFGNCASLFVPKLDDVTCVGQWDIMSQAEPNRHQFTAFSLLGPGWLRPDQTATIDTGAGPASETFTMQPIELPPVPGRPSALRIPTGDPAAPTPEGLYAECRGNLGIDSTLPSFGVLISAAKYGVPMVPPLRVLRQIAPVDKIDDAPLKPGETYTDKFTGVKITFDRYAGTAETSACVVTVESGSTPWSKVVLTYPHPPHGPIYESGGFFKPHVWIDSPRNGWNRYGNASIEKHGLVIVPDGTGDIPWAGHVNRVWVAAYNAGNVASPPTLVRLHAQQPATVADRCGFAADTANAPPITIETMPASSYGYGYAQWRASPATSASFEVSLQSRAQVPLPETQQGVSMVAWATQQKQARSSVVSIRFNIARDKRCSGAASYIATPVLPRDWAQRGMPRVNLMPGQTKAVALVLQTPNGSMSSRPAEIPVIVQTGNPSIVGGQDSPDGQGIRAGLPATIVSEFDLRLVQRG